MRWSARHTGPLWPALNSLGSEPPRFASEAAAAPPRCAKAADSAELNTQDHGREYQGGLRIQADGDTAQLLPLARGDALMHESDLQVRSYVFVHGASK